MKIKFKLKKKTNQVAYLHPESILFYVKEKPEFIIFNEVVVTMKTYLREASEIPFRELKEVLNRVAD